MVDSSDYIFNLVLGLIFVLVAVFMVFKATRSKNHISAPAQPAGTAYYDGSGDFNGINATGDVYQPGNTSGMYTPGMSNMDNISYPQHQTATPQPLTMILSIHSSQLQMSCRPLIQQHMELQTQQPYHPRSLSKATTRTMI